MENKLILLFSGQGAQAVGMGKSLYDNDPNTAQWFDRAEEMLKFPLKHLCFEGPEEALKETKICQPALYVLGYAIFDALKRSGCSFSASLGLSLGELTALASADVFDFETGLRIVEKRSSLMQEACLRTHGGMICLIGSAIEKVDLICKEHKLDLANVNAPDQVVLAGELSKLPAAAKMAEHLGFKVVHLNVAGAYHSRLMESASAEFENFLSNCSFKEPRWTVFSNTTGQSIQHLKTIQSALVKQLTSTVLWSSCVQNAIQQFPNELLVECGPKKVLAGLVHKMNKSMILGGLVEQERRSIPVQSLCEHKEIVDFIEKKDTFHVKTPLMNHKMDTERHQTWKL